MTSSSLPEKNRLEVLNTMEDNDYVLAFDHFYTTNHIQILKSLLPFIENENSSILPAVIKYMELKYTLSLIEKGRRPIGDGGIRACSKGQNEKDANNIENNIEQIYNAVHRYLAPDEEKKFTQLLSAMRTMKNMREMQQMLEILQSLNPDSDTNGNTGFGGMDINELMQMLNQYGGN